MNLNGKRILLTGATGGIGAEMAKALADAGAKLLLTGRNQKLLAELQLSVPNSHIVVADLSDQQDRHSLIQQAAAMDIDVLINAAGVNQLALLGDTSDKAMIQQLHTNLIMPMQLCRDMLPLLVQQKAPVIVNVGSILGSIGYPGSSVYCASKFGLRGFTEALRRELADTPIQVLYFAPRATATAMNTDNSVAMNEALGVAMDPPQWVADALVKFLQQRHPHSAYLGWPEKLFVRINAILPRLVDSSLLKQLPIIRQFAKQ